MDLEFSTGEELILKKDLLQHLTLHILNLELESLQDLESQRLQ